MMKVYGHPFSTCTRKVIATLEEVGTPYELTVVDFAKMEHKSEAHVARQPWGKIPAIDDDGFALYESRAICRYVNDKAGGALAPSDARGRGEMERWISVETSYFSPAAMKFVYHHVMKRNQDAETLDKAGAELDLALGVLDARLATVPYLAGDAFTLADVCYLPYVEYLTMTPVKEKLAAHRHVQDWWNRCSERPSWRKAANR